MAEDLDNPLSELREKVLVGRTLFAPHAERMLGDAVRFVQEHDVQIASQIVGMEADQTPAIHQFRTGVHPIQTVLPSDLQRRLRVQVDGGVFDRHVFRSDPRLDERDLQNVVRQIDKFLRDGRTDVQPELNEDLIRRERRHLGRQRV